MKVNNPAQPGLSLTVAETEVFNGTSPISWTDLNLSGVVGARHAIVLLKIFSPWAGGGLQASFRAKGETEYVSTAGNTSYSAALTGQSVYAMVFVHTDADGIVEWNCDRAEPNFTIDVVAFLSQG